MAATNSTTDKGRTRRGWGEGSLRYDAGRGRWEATIEAGVDPISGRRLRHKVTGRTKAAALARMKEARGKVDRQVRPGTGLTVGELLDRWLVEVVDGRVGSDNTRSNYSQIVRLHLKPGLGDVRIDRLTPEMVDRLLAAKADDGLSRSHVGRMRSTLAGALRHAERRGLVTRNAAQLSAMPRTKPPAMRRSLTIKETRAVMAAAAGERLEALIVVGLSVGLRPGELCGLHWTDLDLEDDPPTLTVAGALKRTARIGQGQRGYDLVLGDVKRSTAGRRTLALPPAAVKALRAHEGRQEAERLDAGDAWTDQGLVFANARGGLLDPTHVRRVFSRVAEDAGIDGGFTYMMRHTAASLLIDAGAGIEEVADMLGDDARTLLRHYRHATRPVAGAGLAMDRVLKSG